MHCTDSKHSLHPEMSPPSVKVAATQEQKKKNANRASCEIGLREGKEPSVSLVSEAQLRFQHRGESHASQRKVLWTVVSCTVAPPWGKESQGQRKVQNAPIWMAVDYIALLPAIQRLRKFPRTRTNMALALAMAELHNYYNTSLKFTCNCASLM